MSDYYGYGRGRGKGRKGRRWSEQGDQWQGGGPPPWAGGQGQGMGRGMGRGRGRGRGGGWGYPPPGYPQAGFTGPMPPQAMSVEPPRPGVLRIAATVLEDRGLDSTIAPMFARAPFVALIDTASGEIVDAKIIPNAFANAPQGAGMGFAQWLVQVGVRIVLGSNIGPNAAMALQQAGIRIHNVPAGTRLRDALRSLGLIR